MALLLGAITAILAEGYKTLAKKYGEGATRNVIFIFLFIATVVWTILLRQNIVTQETLKWAIEIFTTAIATYELVIKSVLKIINLPKREPKA